MTAADFEVVWPVPGVKSHGVNGGALLPDRTQRSGDLALYAPPIPKGDLMEPRPHRPPYVKRHRVTAAKAPA